MDFHDTYAPSSRPSSLRMCLAAAAKEGLKGEQADLKSAFCHTILPATDPPIYMYQVEGIDHPDYPRDEYVCMLIMGLYGLHQINCYYWRQFADYLIAEGFQQSAYDPCMFIGDNCTASTTPSHNAGYVTLQHYDVTMVHMSHLSVPKTGAGHQYSGYWRYVSVL